MTTLIPKVDLKNGGSTPAGAVNRPINEKLGEIISVKDFGAKGDGSTDDTAAIQAAIDYCTSLSVRQTTLYFPNANAAAAYVVTAPLVIRGIINLVGDSQFSAIIYAKNFTSGQYVLDFDCVAADQIYYCGISNLKITSNNALPIGVRLKNTSYVVMKRVTLQSLLKGIVCDGTVCFSNSFEEVTLYGITSYGVQWLNTFAGGGQWMFSACTFNGSDGVVVQNGAGLDTLGFYNCNFEQCTTTDMYINGTVQGLTINNCRSEGLNGGTSFLIQPASGSSVVGLNITGCFWSSDFGNGNPINIDGNVKGYNITGNYAGYIGFNQFVYLGASTGAGVISGNFCVNSPKVVNQANAGLTLLNNNNAAGALPDYFGMTLTDDSGAGLTFSAAEGTYSKVGNNVFWKAWIIFPTTSSTAAANIAGLPYPIASLGTWVRGGANVDITDYSAGPIYVAQGVVTSTSFQFFSSATSALTNANLSGKTLYLSGMYST